MILGEAVVALGRPRERVGDRREAGVIARARGPAGRPGGTVRNAAPSDHVALPGPDAVSFELLHPGEDELVERQGHGVAGPRQALAGRAAANGAGDVRRRRHRSGRAAQPELLVNDAMQPAVEARRERPR